MKTYIGIDPGSKGFISVLHPNGNREFLSIEDATLQEVVEFLSRQKHDCDKLIAIMEDVHAIYGSSAGSTFEFGKINGILEGFLIALKIPYSLVPPKEWQGKIWITPDKVWKTGKLNQKTGRISKTVDTKPTSMNAALRLFPDIDFRKNERCKKLDDNKVDAVLICEYARRENL